MIDSKVPVLGFAAFSGTGKTTLLTRLIPLLKQHGLRIALIKHAHHHFDIDHPGKDSYRLREAGASPVMLSSKFRRAVITELEDPKEPLLAEQLEYLDRSNLNLILVEGFKRERFPKIELYRAMVGKPLLFPNDDSIIAIATDSPLAEKPPIPVLDLNSPERVAQFILNEFMPGCLRAHECAPRSAQAMLSLDQAREIVCSRIAPLEGYEQVVLKNALSRVLVEDIVAPFDIPRQNQSSMDGYALNSRELNQAKLARFKIAGTSWAGRPYLDAVGNAECVRIFTGADLPPGTDSVVIQENVTVLGAEVEIPSHCQSQENVRQRGDEIQKGQRVLQQGKRLSPADLGILASLGMHEVRVRRKPRVAFFSTGDELVSLDQTLEDGQIHDSNRYLLYGMLKALGIDPLDLGALADDHERIVETLQEAAAIADVVISSGGVSVGQADLVRKALAAAGQIEFWKIAVKPGKPLAFGRIGSAHFFGLPGNPVSVFVTFYQLVRPALLRLMGANPGQALRTTATCVSKIHKTPGRQEFQRGKLFLDEKRALVLPADKQQSHNLSAMAECNCFIVLPADCAGLEAGSRVEVEPIESAFHFN